MRKITNEIGNKYGRLTVESYSHSVRGQSYWNCSCTCGGSLTPRIDGLHNGKVYTCGCSHTTHGMAGTGVYASWRQMMYRCYNKEHISFPNYGGRGITVSKRWHKFENFLADMGPRGKGLSLERIDNAKNYNKNNCCWVTKKQQARNRRSNRLITFRGRTMCLIEWCEELKLPYMRTYKRLYVQQLPIKKAFFK